MSSLNPRILPVRATCPDCEMEIQEAVVTPMEQFHGPLVKTLREAYGLHVLAVVNAATATQARRVLCLCSGARVPRALGPCALGERETAAHEAQRSLKLAGGPVDAPVGKSSNGRR